MKTRRNYFTVALACHTATGFHVTWMQLRVLPSPPYVLIPCALMRALMSAFLLSLIVLEFFEEHVVLGVVCDTIVGIVHNKHDTLNKLCECVGPGTTMIVDCAKVCADLVQL